MDNNTRPEHFVLKEGLIKWIPKMPDSADFVDTDDNASGSFDNKGYEAALQSAIDSAVEVSNQEEVEKRICEGIRAIPDNCPIPLQCSVEKKEYCPDFEYTGKNPFDCPFGGSPRHKIVAHVTFPSSHDLNSRIKALEEELHNWLNYGESVIQRERTIKLLKHTKEHSSSKPVSREESPAKESEPEQEELWRDVWRINNEFYFRNPTEELMKHYTLKKKTP